MIKITQEDNMELMSRYPDNHFDLAIVDPPYGIGLKMVENGCHGTKQKRKEGKKYKSIHKIKDWNDSIPSPEYFEQLHRVTKDQIIWGCNYYAKYIPAIGRIVHDKKTEFEGTKINFSHGDIASCSKQKRITFFRYRWSGNRQGNTINWKNEGADQRIHPTQKPIALYEWLLLNYAKEGDKILDTHLGSGSIAIACHNLHYNLTACEIDPEYCEAAKKRLENHELQLNIF